MDLGADKVGFFSTFSVVHHTCIAYIALYRVLVFQSGETDCMDLGADKVDFFSTFSVVHHTCMSKTVAQANLL